MKETVIYKPSQFAKMIGVHIKTLQRWDNGGIFVAHRTPAGRRYYTDEDYKKYLRGKRAKEKPDDTR